VSLRRTVYELDAALVNEKVTLAFDPSRVPPESVPRSPRNTHRRYTHWPRYLEHWPLAVCWGQWDLGATGAALSERQRLIPVGHQAKPFREEKIEQFLAEQVPLRETRRYREMMTQLKGQGTAGWRKWDTREQIEAYLQGVLDLCRRIRTDGYCARPEGAPAKRSPSALVATAASSNGDREPTASR
jgi:hypothetical protein